ncbi:WD domain, G-beta repeat, putative [Angomonas deanei]|uniref:WD domain, G-beta repeat, putative n=1 Tax=Angomonas deanei TaxID=59799 RepID=A0A7G2CCY2_9TRYP|nr:WD domain, G-beta repeat, putative [Angomonas deanei]
MGGVVKLWETNSRNLVSTFKAHQEPIKSADLTPDATLFSTGSSDGRVTLWDVEHATCTQTLTNKDGLPVGQHLHHPSDPFTQLLVALDKKVVLYDTRVSCSKHQREYTGHMGTIFNVTLLSGGSKFLTTAEDRTLRTWDFRIPIQVKQFADAAMHAISHVVHHPSQPFLAAQSLDNRITVFKDEGGGKLKSLHQRSFTGHTITGTRCQLAFSADGKFISSGDISGNLHVWDWESGASVKTFKAHKDMLTSHVWHPADKSKVVTASWDNTVKLWA